MGWIKGIKSGRHDVVKFVCPLCVLYHVSPSNQVKMEKKTLQPITQQNQVDPGASPFVCVGEMDCSVASGQPSCKKSMQPVPEKSLQNEPLYLCVFVRVCMLALLIFVFT